MTSVFKKITSKIADIFNIFDFSFIISGFTAFVVICVFLLFRYNDVFLLLQNYFRWYIVIPAIYILGLVMFGIGRYARQELFQHKKRKYELFKKYGFCTQSEDEIDAIYCQYWDNLKKEDNKYDYEYYNRMWVMTAVYEGLIGDAILACTLLIPYSNIINNNKICYAIMIIVFIVAIFFLFIYFILFREARKYADTIVKDLLAKNNNYRLTFVCKE
ncbi:MAG: hypothetical protein J6V44_03890 [Methanobrevibacter sp.]|nr:hypothetical protein [Methanobrevibacter sp.]